MRTANNTNNHTVEGLVAKYRNFVKDSIADWQWELNRRIEFNELNHMIFFDDKFIHQKGHEHGDYSDYQHILKFFIKNFPGCDSDKEFTDGLSAFCLSNDIKPIADYMNALNSKCRADYQLLFGLYKIVAKQKASPRAINEVSKYIDAFSQKAFNDGELKFLCENFSDVVSYEFEHEKDWFQPTTETRYPLIGSTLSTWIIDYLHELVTVSPDQTVYVINAGRGTIAQSFPKSIVKGVGYGGTEGALGQILLYSVTGGYSEIVPYSDFTMPQKNSVDVIILDALEHISGIGAPDFDLNSFYDSLKDGGKMIIFATRLGVLSYKESRDKWTKGWYAFLQRLIEEKAIDSIISLEKDIHSAKEIIMGDKDDILLCIEKKDHLAVRFINDKTHMSSTISVDDLDSNLLWPSYYLTKRPENGRPLGSIVHNVAGFKHGFLSAFNNPLEEANDGVLVIEPTDLSDSYKDCNLGDNSLLPVPKKSYRYYSVPVSCVYAYCNSEKLVVGYLDDMSQVKSIANNSISGLVPKRNIDPRYISALMLMPEVKQQILSICDGIVSALDYQTILDRIIVPKHTPKERLQFLAEANYDALRYTKQELKKNHEDYKKAVRMRKHALTQSLSSIEAMFYSLNACRIRQNGRLENNDVISRLKGTTAKGAFEYIEPNLKNMMFTLEHIADVEYSFGNVEGINPEEFIEDYIAEYETGWLNFKPVVTWEKGHNLVANDVKDPKTGNIILRKGTPAHLLHFAKDALEHIFNNIISNAIAHGFTDENRKDYQLRFSWYSDGLAVIVEIENNGTPIPSNRDTATLLEYGVSTALHKDGHNGIGCNEIDDIMRRYGGKVELLSTPNEEFTVKYILTFRS